jgi:tight adherence protein C
MTVPLILFILPVLFIVILGPAACSIADAFSGDGPPGGASGD